MTKVYDALRQAEAERQERAQSHVSTSVLFDAVKAESQPTAGVPAATGDELSSLRNILLGGVVSEFEQALARMEQQMAQEEASLRAELSKFEQRIEDRLVEVDSRSCHSQAELREHVLAQSNKLGDLIKERSAEAIRIANDGLQGLRQSKLNDAEFATFVRGLASHLGDESKA